MDKIAIAECLKHHTKDISVARATAGNGSFYSVQVRSDYNVIDLYFPTAEIAARYYDNIDRKYKILYEHNQDGTRSLLRREKVKTIAPFDYYANIKDIYSVPCKCLNVQGRYAFAHTITRTYIYRFITNKNYWRLYDIEEKY